MRRLLPLTHTALFGVATIALLFALAVYIAYAANLIAFPFDYDQGEGFELVDTVMFSQGRWPYQNTEVYPFYASNYPPLYHILAAPFVWLFGPAYWYGRLLSFLTTLVSAATIAYAVQRTAQHRWIAVLSGLAFLASNTIYHIGPLFRQHIVMVMFELLAVVILANANEISDTHQRRRRLVLGFALIIAAGYTKQLAAITALAVGLFMFIRQPRHAVVWGSGAVVVGAGIFAWMTISTNGEWWRQAILANANEMKILQSVALFKQWFGVHGFLIVPALLVVIYEVYFARISLYAWWFVLAAALNGLASGTWGGGDSYFSTAIAATCILSGIFAARTLRSGWAFPPNYLSRWLIDPLRRYAPVLSATALVIIPLLYIGYARATLHLPTQEAGFKLVADLFGITPNAQNGFYDSARSQDGQYATGYAAIGHFVTAADHAAGWQMVDLIRASQKPVISEEAGFSLMAGRDVITNPTQLLNLDNKGLFKPGDLIPMIERRDFGLIIFRAQFYPASMLVAVADNYEQQQVIEMNGFKYLILAPKP